MTPGSAASRTSSCCARSSFSSSIAPRPTPINNLAKANIASGFGFWNNTAGFDISQTLIEYSTVSTYGRAFWVGLLNTLLVAAIGIVLATILGFVIGMLRLSKNFLISRLAAGYVEVIRNLPLLLQLLFWYNAVLKALPELRDSVVIPGGSFLNNRGLFVPQPIATERLRRGVDFVLRRHRRLDPVPDAGQESARSRPASRRRSFWCRSASSSDCRSWCSSSPACRSN